MSGYPIVRVASGGFPVTETTEGFPVEDALSGWPVTFVDEGGYPVTSVFNPANLFANGETGLLIGPSYTPLFQDAAQTTPATADTDPVGYATDGSGNGEDVTQSSVNSRPTLNTLSGRRIFRFDGLDDHLISTFNPTTTGTLVVVGTFDATADILMGSQPASNGRCYIASNGSGRLGAGIGTQNSAAISSTGDPVTGVFGANFADWNGTTVNLHRNRTNVYSQPQSGAVNTTVPIYVGALNNNGSLSSAADMDAALFLFIDRVLTQAERNGICALYGL